MPQSVIFGSRINALFANVDLPGENNRHDTQKWEVTEHKTQIDRPEKIDYNDLWSVTTQFQVQLFRNSSSDSRPFAIGYELG